MKIYMAGPLFTAAEQAFNAALATRLRHYGEEIWLPQENETRDTSPEEIFAKDVEGVDWAEMVLANMDGSDPDSGTCWECGYAFEKKPIIIYRTDFRQAGDHKTMVNLMLEKSADIVLDLRNKTMSEICDAIINALVDLNEETA